MSGAGADFIPLSSNSDKSGKKRKHKDNNKDQHEHRSGSNKDGRHHEHRSGSNKSSERDRDPKSSQVKNESWKRPRFASGPRFSSGDESLLTFAFRSSSLFWIVLKVNENCL